MSTNGPRNNRVDSGYGTDSIPSPLSANVRAKPVFFGEEYTPSETEVNKNSQGENKSNNSHEVVEPSQNDVDDTCFIDGVEANEDISNGGAACNSEFKLNETEAVEVINPSNSCDIVHNELGDGDTEGLSETVLTKEFTKECSDERPFVPMVNSSSKSCARKLKFIL